MDIEFMFTETIELLRPKMPIYYTYDDAAEELNRIALNQQALLQQRDLLSTEPEAKVGPPSPTYDDDDDEYDEITGGAERRPSVNDEDDEEDDDHDDDEDDDQPESEIMDDEETVVVHIDGPEVDEEADIEFEREFSKIMQESIESRKYDKKPAAFDVAIPVRSKTFVVDRESDEMEGKVTFSLLMKRGAKQQIKTMALPADSALAISTRSKQEAEQVEKLQLKQLVLSYEERERQGVSAISLGSWITYGSQIHDTAAEDILKTSFDAGVNYFDTAESYSDGKSEIVLGNALKKFGWKRSQYVVSTKIYFGASGPNFAVNERGLSRKHIIEGIQASLERLQLEYVDIVFAHRPDNLTPTEEIVRAFNWAIEKGLAFYWGTSEWSAEQITEAHGIAIRLGLIGPVVEQPQYNLLFRERFEKEYAPLYKKIGTGTTIWSPLAGGVLTGKYLDGLIPEGSRITHSYNKYIDTWRARLLESEEGKQQLEKTKKLLKIAEKLGVTPSQISIAWILKNKNISTIII
ncbi:hypothetical protein HK096_005558, partial [Nowakowskiella sp. JEL0078]